MTGGQTVFNPWTIIGGVATSVTSQNEFILYDQERVTGPVGHG